MTSTIIIKTTEKEKFYRDIKELAKAIAELKAALAIAEPLAISHAAYRVITPYDAMSDQATVIFADMASSPS